MWRCGLGKRAVPCNLRCRLVWGSDAAQRSSHLPFVRIPIPCWDRLHSHIPILFHTTSHTESQISFHDTSKMPGRPPVLSDPWGLTMASLGLSGALHASPSTLVYRWVV